MAKFTSAVILAAGNGSRFGGKVKKQFADILGEPCIVRTVRAFEECDLIDEIILVGDNE
ncbi:MAG: NTP transferase domain-containing protein, partial [Clostridia bacterium]|nr:NTP transferase domain-containing protein [Clostridia bacterium]